MHYPQSVRQLFHNPPLVNLHECGTKYALTQVRANTQGWMKESEALFTMRIQQFEYCEETCDGMSEAEIDEMLAESFPVSDPPSSTLGIDEHCESAKKESKLSP